MSDAPQSEVPGSWTVRLSAPQIKVILQGLGLLNTLAMHPRQAAAFWLAQGKLMEAQEKIGRRAKTNAR